MKLVNYQLQTQIEYLSEDKSNSHFKEYIQNILEDTSKPYYQRCDYVGLSLNELKLKIDSLGKDIQELQALKKKLSSSLELAKELTAEVLINNGIDRIDGTIISSLTLTKLIQTTKETITVKDDNAVMGLGYVKFSVDEEAIQKAIKTKEGLEELKEYININTLTTTTLPKVKVNTKRNSNNEEQTNEILIIEKQAA
ncbi:siphovirus Gp157 family protein [Arcobacter sp. KX21116]|uniref:siphovirus Gp157 family protein n=1 Tax=Arcobacter iocasae TaxID=2906515 RepID=UPI0035D4BE62